MSDSSDWLPIKFGDMVEGFRGVSYQPHDLLDEHTADSVILLRANNIQRGNLEFDDIQIVSKRIVKAVQLLAAGDIAVCMSNGSKHLVGKSAQFNDERNTDCTVGAFCSVFKAKQGADPGFIKQLFLSSTYQAHIDFSLAGSAINNLKNSDIESITFSVPSKEKQRKIACILQTLDQTIEKTEALIEKYQQIKAGLMHDLFTRGIGADGKLRPPREQVPELYQETPIGWIPREWKAKTVKALLQDGVFVDVQDGNHGELHPKKNDFVDEGVPFIMASDIAKGFVDIGNSYKISEVQYSGLRIGFSKAGDVLLSHKASIGFVALVPDDIPRIMLTPQVTYYRTSGEEISPEYLCRFMRSDIFQVPLKSLAQQSTRDYIGILAQKNLFIAFPGSLVEQEKIATRVSYAEKKVLTEQTFLKSLKNIKYGLMHDLLTGKVPVKVDVEQSEAVHV